MKKKGLIISTVVMVVVLIASLTTATYAWFTTTAVTSIAGFNVSVEAGNVMNIGLNSQGYDSYNVSASPDSFVSGDCKYTNGDEGQLGGYWTGNIGLGATITHDIVWSSQSKAVGFSSDTGVDTAATNATFAKTGFISQTNWTRIIAANGTKTTMESPRYALANKKTSADSDNSTNGDYVYMFLGAQPTTALKANTNKLHIVIQPQGNGTTNGMAAAIHVAYKVNGASNWTDVDFSEKAATNAGKYSSARNGNTAYVYGDIIGKDHGFTGNVSYDSGTLKTTIPGAVNIDIDLTEYTNASAAAPLDQIQLVIYLAGADEDCIDSAKNGQIKIGIYFGAQEATTSGN